MPAHPAMPAITVDQMREVDRLVVEVYGTGLVQMMEHAGRNLAELARILLGGAVAGKSVLIAAGKGNNGGGGLVAARHLSNWGAVVTALIESSAALRDVPLLQWRALHRLPARREEGSAALETMSHAQTDLVIDALVGYGLDAAPRGWIAKMIGRINTQAAPVLALDVPSGLDATTGAAYTPCVKATTTMTLALPKTGLLVPVAQPYVGMLYLADIGVPPVLYAHLGLDVEVIFAQESIIQL